MPQGLSPKQRNTVYQHWCSQITREGRDLAALERISARALHDRDVCADALLHSMVRTGLERQRAEVQRAEQTEQENRTPATAVRRTYSGTSRRDDSDLPRSHGGDTRSAVTLPPAAPALPPPDPDRVALRQWVEDLSEALKAGDENAAHAVCAQLRGLHQRRSEIVLATDLEKYEQRVTKLHNLLNEHRAQIATLTEQARVAAEGGQALTAVNLIHRLTAIHAAHPRLLDAVGLNKARADVTRATEGHEDGVTTRKLLERERAVAAEMKRLASAVSEFHRAVFSHPENRAEFRQAARVYLGVLHEIRLHEKDWLAEFVLELGDVLANWNVPPPGAEHQINRFLEKVRGALHRIHIEIGEIDIKRGESGEPGSSPTPLPAPAHFRD